VANLLLNYTVYFDKRNEHTYLLVEIRALLIIEDRLRVHFSLGPRRRGLGFPDW